MTGSADSERIVGTRLREEDGRNYDLRVGADAQDAGVQAAALFSELARDAIARRGRFNVLLAGGSTPRPMYERLTQLPLDWERIHLFWGDERMVGPDDPQSNFGSFRKTVLERVPIPPQNIHRVRTEAGKPSEVAESYEREMREAFGAGKWPRFDLAIQGMGADGHTASLFPGSVSEHDSPHWVIAPYVEKLGAFRISVPLGVLNAARAVLFLVTGPEKAEMVRRVLRDRQDHKALLPAQRVNPDDGRLFWFLDRSAASRL